MHDQGQRAAWRQHLVHRICDLGFVRPVEGLAEGDQPVGAGRRGREVFGQGLHPADVGDASLVGNAAPFGEHCRVEADRVCEQVGEPDGEDPGAAAGVEQPPTPVEIELLGENGPRAVVSRAAGRAGSGLQRPDRSWRRTAPPQDVTRPVPNAYQRRLSAAAVDHPNQHQRDGDAGPPADQHDSKVHPRLFLDEAVDNWASRSRESASASVPLQFPGSDWVIHVVPVTGKAKRSPGQSYST